SGALYAFAPPAAVAEEVAGAWLIDLLGLPAGTSVGFVTGATMANFTALAAARHGVPAKTGWERGRPASRPRHDRLGRRATGSSGCAARGGHHPRWIAHHRLRLPADARPRAR